MQCVNLLQEFDNFISEETWNSQFDMRLETYLS